MENNDLIKVIEITSDVPLKPTTTLTPTEENYIKKLQVEEEKIANYEKHIRTIERELGPIDWKYTSVNENTDPKPFKACELRDIILSRHEYNIITDKHSQVIYLYTETTGIYHKDGEQYLRFLIDRVLGNESTQHRINETIELLKIRTYATIEASPKIAVLNGLLDIATGNIEPFTLYDFNTNKLNVEYKEDAKSEDWENFINQICPDDKELLQEWSGYLLIKGYPYHAIMWLYGPRGRNGKGVWARTMQSILGEENYSSVSIDEFDGKHRFAVFNLHYSLFNICSEPRADRVLTIEMLQALTGQDTIDAERKGVQERFKFRNPAKMTVMGNKFPSVDNPTTAFWERLKLIKFPFRFIGKECVPDLERKWLDDPEQRSGVLNWMIQGALRLKKNNGTFTNTKTQEETIIQFKRAGDNVASFIVECLLLKTASITTKADAQEHYKNYCAVIGVEPKSANELNEKLGNVPGVKVTSTRIGIGKEKKKTKVWKGFSLKELPDEEEKEDEERESEDSPQALSVESGTSGTSGTTLTPFIPLNFYEKLRNINISRDKGLKLVPAVPAVPDLKPESNTKKPSENNIIYYKQLAPNDIHKCGGYGCESNEAQYQTKTGFWCKTHLTKIVKDCFENGFIMQEKTSVYDHVEGLV